MSTLTVTFPDGRKPFEVIDDDDTTPGKHYAHIVETMYYYGGIGVYRAQADFGDSCIAIADNAAEIERLKSEREVFKALKRLQGDAISRFYGLFRGKDPESGSDAAVIAVAMVGKMLDDQGRLSGYPLNDRLKITRLVGKVHLEGMLPQFDLGGANISRAADPEVFWLADFKGIVPHECPWDGEWHAGEDAPELEDFKCESLYDIGMNMAIWKPHIYPVTDVEGHGFLDMSSGKSLQTITTITHSDSDDGKQP